MSGLRNLNRVTVAKLLLRNFCLCQRSRDIFSFFIFFYFFFFFLKKSQNQEKIIKKKNKRNKRKKSIVLGEGKGNLISYLRIQINQTCLLLLSVLEWPDLGKQPLSRG